jgi:hypothetical protein
MRLTPIRPIGQRMPSRLQTAPFGTTNPAVVGKRVPPLPAIVSTGVPFAREHFTDGQPMAPGLTRLQNKIAAALSALAAQPDADQVVIQGQAFTSGTAKAIAHTLGRPYVGYSVSNVVGTPAAFAATAPADTRLAASQITLTASANCTADVTVW